MFNELQKKLKNELLYLQKVAQQKTQQVQNTASRATNAVVQPLRTHAVNFTTQLQRNLRAEAALRSNQRQENKPATPNKYNPNASQRSIKSGGLESNAHRVQEPGSKITIDGKVVHETPGNTSHGISFYRDTFDEGDGLKPRQNISPQNAKVRIENLKYQLGTLLSEVQPGDRVHADPITSPNGRNPRAALYDRATKGALASKTEDYGTPGRPEIYAEIDSTRNANNQWRNIKGQKVQFDPETLKQGLKDLAKGKITGAVVRSVIQHPIGQAIVLGDEVIGGITGERPSERIGRGHRQTIEKNIRERLKNGDRFFNPQPYQF
jgi:hypothetical protein